MKTGALFSGGKDSAYAIYLALNQAWDVSCLINVRSEDPHSFMFHHPNQNIIKLQSEKAEIPLIQRETGEGKELEHLEKAIEEAKKEFNLDAITTGAVASSYQKKRIDHICHQQDLKSFSPLWMKDQKKIMDNILRAGFEIRVSEVAAEGLTEEWLGKKIDGKALQELEEIKGINVAGEGGEWESTVLNAPFFREKIEVKKSEKNWEKDRGTWKIKEAT